MEATKQPEETTTDRAPPQEQRTAIAIDVRKLADKVYRLMVADLRLEQARGARTRRRWESRR